MEERFYSFTEAAHALGLHRTTVAQMVERIGIPIFDHPLNRNAKAINRAGLRTLKHRLRPIAVKAA